MATARATVYPKFLTVQNFLYLFFLLLFSLDFLQIRGWLPGSMFMVIPELLSGVMLLIVCGCLAVHQKLRIDTKYVVMIAILLVHIIIGTVINATDPGTVIGGMRTLFKYVPFFLLPLVMRFSDDQLHKQVSLLALLLCIQLPVSLIQRFIWHADVATGDVVRGTFPTGSMESLALICGIAIVLSCFLKRYIKLPTAAVLIGLFIAPTLFNETKGSLILLPIAVMIPFFFVEKRRDSKGTNGSAILVLSGILVIFFLGYNYSQSTFGGSRPLHEYFTSPYLLMNYLAPQTAGIEAAGDRHGRVDQVIAPFEEMKDQPVNLIAGLGLGALAKNPFEMFSGDEHLEIREEGIALISTSTLIWELGVFGLILIFTLKLFVMRDAVRASRASGLRGCIALGWIAVVPIIILSFFWKQVMEVNAIMYLFAYFSGHVVATSYELRRAQAANTKPQGLRPISLAKGHQRQSQPPQRRYVRE